ncbi:MAG: RNA polymerase sigma factor [Planctomycetota bacterium]|jgi:RNA polymerase sigma-70 factor (ECF subfamily)
MSHNHIITPDHDTQLMLNVADGNRKGFERLYRKYFPILSQFLIERNGHRLSLDDIVQKVFTCIWEQRKNFRAESSFQTYLFSVAKNIFSEEEKHFNKNNMTHLGIDLYSSHEPADSKIYGHHLEITRLLYEAIDDLPAKGAQAIKLYYFKNKSTSDAARIAGCSPEAFRKRLYRARSQLRDVLNPSESADLFSKK